MLFRSDTYVKPIEPIDYYAPFWGKKSDTEPRSRLEAQRTALLSLTKRKTIYLSTDGGLYSPQDFTYNIGAVKLSSIIQSPLLTEPVVNANVAMVSPHDLMEYSPSAIMTAGEFRFILCKIKQMHGESVLCESFGCPAKNCPLKKVDFEQYHSFVKEGAKIAAFLDRPVCANYLRNFTERKNQSNPSSEGRMLINLFKDLLSTAKKYKVPVISAKESSSHKALIRTMIDILAGQIGRAHV